MQDRCVWGVSSSGRASALHAEGEGFESPTLHGRCYSDFASLAQWPEHLSCKQRVVGSTPTGGSGRHSGAPRVTHYICVDGRMVNAPDCKSGSFGNWGFESLSAHGYSVTQSIVRGCSSMVEPQSSKLIVRVRSPSSPRRL